jgi:hypothetical protein
MHTKKFLNFIQSGMYLDYIIKKIAEMFVKNIFIYSSTFFGEKFIIEFLSKKTIDNLTSFFNVLFLNKNYNYTNFYNNLVISVLVFLVLYECFYLL